MNDARKSEEREAHQHDSRNIGDAAGNDARNGAVLHGHDLCGREDSGEESEDEPGHRRERDGVKRVLRADGNIDEECDRNDHHEAHEVRIFENLNSLSAPGGAEEVEGKREDERRHREGESRADDFAEINGAACIVRLRHGRNNRHVGDRSQVVAEDGARKNRAREHRHVAAERRAERQEDGRSGENRRDGAPCCGGEHGADQKGRSGNGAARQKSKRLREPGRLHHGREDAGRHEKKEHGGRQFRRGAFENGLPVSPGTSREERAAHERGEPCTRKRHEVEDLQKDEEIDGCCGKEKKRDEERGRTEKEGNGLSPGVRQVLGCILARHFGCPFQWANDLRLEFRNLGCGLQKCKNPLEGGFR